MGWGVKFRNNQHNINMDGTHSKINSILYRLRTDLIILPSDLCKYDMP